MKKILILLLMLITLFRFSIPIEAHPGGTDGSGCHRCLTNCYSYGLSTGQYHCRSTSGSSSSSSGGSGTFFLLIIIGLGGFVVYIANKNNTSKQLDNSKMIKGIEDIKDKLKDL